MINFDIQEYLNPHGTPRKEKRREFKAYLAFFAERNPFCCVAGCNYPSQLHHSVGGRSRNNRSHDSLVVNVCAKHHSEIGSNKLFQQRHNVSFANIITTNLEAYADYLGVIGDFHSLEELERVLLEASKYKKAA